MTEIAAPPDSAYLDAARECIVAVGWRRTTLTDIAKRAGVSRMTIYRRWPDTRALLGDLLVREWTDLMSRAGFAPSEQGTGRDAIADGVSSMVRALRRNELFQRIIDVDPELLHPYLFERRGRNQQWMLDLLETAIKQGQADGSVRGGKPQALARTILLAAQGFALSTPTMADRAVSTRALDDELRLLVESYLAP